jgi:Secretion system C-terminal sorting domain
MKKSLIFCLMFIIWLSCLADPEWVPVIYTNSTVAYSLVTIDEISASDTDLVGAFVEAECRGLGEVFLDAGIAYCTMNIQGNTTEQVSFLVWDQSIDTICSVDYTTMTNPGYDIGYPPDFLPVEAFSGNPINHYPVMNLPENFVIPEDIPTTYDFSEFCSDIDNDPLVVTGENSEHIFVSGNGLIVTFSSTENWVGFENVTLWLSDGSLLVHDSVEVYVTAVNDPPVITDTYPATGDIEVEQNNPVSFAVIAQDVDSAINYTWYLDDVAQSSTDYIFNYTFTELSTYQVRCLVSDGAYELDAIWQVTVNIEPVSENTLNDYLIVTPNPCSETLHIQWQPQREENCKLALYDLRGRKVMNLIPTRTGYTSAPISHLPAGIYFINFKTPTTNLTKKVTLCQ